MPEPEVRRVLGIDSSLELMASVGSEKLSVDVFSSSETCRRENERRRVAGCVGKFKKAFEPGSEVISNTTVATVLDIRNISMEKMMKSMVILLFLLSPINCSSG